MNSDVMMHRNSDRIKSHMRPAPSIKICPKYKLIAEARVIKNNVDRDPGHTTTGV